MSLLGRVLTSLLLLLHLTAVAGSLLISTPPGDWIRQHSRGYERLVGVYQGWSMFAPNPPIVDRWMVFVGKDQSGEWVTLPPLMGARETVSVEWRYQRAGKLERNLMTTSRRRALRAYGHWLCEVHDSMVTVNVERHSQRSPSPEDRRAGATPTVERSTIRTQRCKR